MSVALERLARPVLVVGGYGYGNVGDEAILAGLLERLEDKRVTVVSRDPEGTRRLHRVDAIGIGRAAGALRRHRAVIIGGGGLFGRDMGAIGRLLPAFGLMAAALGREVLVEGVDLDASLSPSARLLVPALMRRAAHISVRDSGSIRVLRDLGVSADLAPDLSSWMPAAPVSSGRALLRAAGIDTSRPVVGLALTGVQPAAGEDALRAVAGAMEAMPDVQFVFVPMSRHPSVAAHDDLVLARHLRARRPRLAVVGEAPHPSVVLAAFTQLTAVVAMRYHAMLFADRAGVPLVSMAYAEKTGRWLADRGRSPVPARTPDVLAALRDALIRDGRSAPPVPPKEPSTVPAVLDAVAS
jgi:polysaccharide pyruvyl transferase WcaK-like protein